MLMMTAAIFFSALDHPISLKISNPKNPGRSPSRNKCHPSGPYLSGALLTHDQGTRYQQKLTSLIKQRLSSWIKGFKHSVPLSNTHDALG
ncbi:MAG: hypothetical protein EBT06_07630 [Gammaproteobacteria bacterium]|nr:hypothetical protein [Gammaproteobacteria bacterium]NBT44779.1 hypothetical protein [Gammaproteobacteria bacterium]NBY22325.1 hypothetical protein [Gammaproteobacteria bacterium]